MWLYKNIVKPVMVVLGARPNSSVCRFHPSCSDYADQAFAKYGFLKALGKSVWRVLRCGPWSRGGVDLP
jgi:putative membrane protein insertion efficiency factor